MSGNPVPAATPLVTLERLWKHYAGSVALRDLTFEVFAGDVVGLVGPNGSGKSTLVDCVCGVLTVDSGHVRLVGRDITSFSPHASVRHGLSRTFQEPRYFRNLSVLQHFQLANQARDGHGLMSSYLRLAKVNESDEEAIRRAREALAEFGLARFADDSPSVLSYGQAKLFNLALALAERPLVLFLDEPLAGVSPAMVDNLERKLLDLRDAGQTIVLIEHDLDFVAQICNRVVVLSAGEKIAEGAPSVLREDPNVFEVLIGGTAGG